MASIDTLNKIAQQYADLANGRIADIIKSISSEVYTPRAAKATKANPVPGQHASSTQVITSFQGVADVVERLTSLEGAVGRVARVCDNIEKKIVGLDVVVHSVQENSLKSVEVAQAVHQLLVQRFSATAEDLENGGTAWVPKGHLRRLQKAGLRRPSTNQESVRGLCA